MPSQFIRVLIESAPSLRDLKRLVARIRANLTPNLLQPKYRGGATESAGHCYVACEALYHLGARERGYRPAVIRMGDITHWFLIDAQGAVLDPTGDQFPEPVDYAKGRRIGFLTREPSKRARLLMDRVLS
jgi:hypothetical protein